MKLFQEANKFSAAARKGVFWIILMFIISIQILPVRAQIMPLRVEINGVDTSDFPEVRVFLLLRGIDPGTILQEPTGMNLRLTEDDQEQNLLSAEYVDAGVSLVFALDSGDGVLNTGFDLPQVYQRSRDIIYSFSLDRTWMQPGLDTISVLAQDYEGISMIVSLANQPEEVIAALDEYEPAHQPVIAASDSGEHTHSLLIRALEELENGKEGFQQQKIIILFTPGFVGNVEDVVVLAQQDDIRIHVVLVRDSPSAYWSESSRILTERTGGVFIELGGEPDLVSFLDGIRQSGRQILLTYSSGSTLADHRIDVLLDYEGRKIRSSIDYSIILQPPSLSISLYALENIDPQDFPMIEFPEEMIIDQYILVRVDVDYPDGHINRSGQAELHLDDIPIALSEVNGGEVYFFLEYDQIFSGRKEEVLLKVVLTDQFGFEVTAEEAVEPLNPGAGWNHIILVSFLSIVFIGTAVALMIMRFRLPDQNLSLDSGLVDEPLLIESETKNRDIFSPKAYLIPLQGFPEGSRNAYEMYGTTSVGRSMRFADIILHHDMDESTISRLHLTIIDEDGYFAVRDEDSSHGTFLNGELLTALQIVKLTDGDILDLGKVERGGIKLMFKLAGSDCDKNSDSINQALPETNYDLSNGMFDGISG